jgi:hypothetical protein
MHESSLQPFGRSSTVVWLSPGRRVVIMLASLLTAAAGAPAHGFGPRGADSVDARQYVFADALFLQRDNAAVDRPLVVAGGAPAITSGQFESPVATGTRIFVGDLGSGEFGPNFPGWEIGYVGVYGMASRRQAHDPAGGLAAAGPLGTVAGFGDATLATAAYDSQINSAEANLVWHRFAPGRPARAGGPRGWPPPVSGAASRSIDWLFGFRWVGLDETAALGFQPEGDTMPSTYSVTAASNMFAGQTGLRGRWTWDRWALEGWAKVGVAGIDVAQAQTIVDQTGAAEPFRPLRGGVDGNVGLVSDMMLSAIWRINDRCGLRVGYNLFWLTGVALAPDQFDFSASNGPEAGTGVQRTGSVFLNGASAGVEARW